MRVRINDELCEGAGFCVDICPQIFELVGPVAAIKIEEDEEIPEELQELCQEAAESCPSDAIILEE